MNRSRLLNWEETGLRNEGEGDLGEGLTEAELYFWADKKREQNIPCFLAGHTLCPGCRNCACFRYVSSGFRCMCEYGKKMVTPYRIRFMSSVAKAHYMNNEIFCLNHGRYEPKGMVCG